MSYVSKSQYDLFLSYAHRDEQSWIAAFESGLIQELRARLGADPAVWQDTKNIRFGQDWPKEISDAIAGSAIFLAVLSPAYQTSEYCVRERKTFIERFASLDDMKVSLNSGSVYRFLKIIKLPWEDNAHLEFFREAEHLEFFTKGSDGIDRDLVPGTEAFRSRLEEAAYQIAALLKAMRRMGESVFIARPAPDVESAADDLRNELIVRGYVTRPQFPLDDLYADKLIRAEIEPAELSVHLLGPAYDKFAERQLNLALEHGKRLFFWLPRGAKESADSKQLALIKKIRDAEGVAVPFTLLEDVPARTMINEVLNSLKPRNSGAPAAPSPQASVYIVCDPTSSEDSSFAGFLRDQIQSREGFRVQVPESSPSATLSLDALHQQRLRESDGLLLYRKAAPMQWLMQQAPNVLFAEQILQRPPLRSRAFLVDDPALLHNLPNVISRSPNFQMDDLLPFLEPLRQAGEAHAGR